MEFFSNLINDKESALQWLNYNSLKANPDKFQFIVLGKVALNMYISKTNNIVIKSTASAVLLCVTIDNKLKFTEHIEMLPQTASCKLNALRRTKNI